VVESGPGTKVLGQAQGQWSSLAGPGLEAHQPSDLYLMEDVLSRNHARDYARDHRDIRVPKIGGIGG
jgi:hypothetical protein